MRLIDADALKDGYMHMGYDPNEHPEESYMEGWCKGFNAAVDHCIGHVIYAPTIEPERKKGKWNFIGDQMFECTECGVCYTQNQFHQMMVRITDPEFPKFCPNCGADMREEY